MRIDLNYWQAQELLDWLEAQKLEENQLVCLDLDDDCLHLGVTDGFLIRHERWIMGNMR